MCPSCDQWNLVPVEERWETLEECERLVEGAEVRAGDSGVGVARTAAGLELLKASGLSDADIANARYGRRLQRRQRVLQATFAALGLTAIGVGIRAAMSSGSGIVGAYAGGLVGYGLFRIWRAPPIGWLRVVVPSGRTLIIWPWQLKKVRLVMRSENAPPELVVPRLGEDLRLSGDEAVDVLACLLPQVNGPDCVDASIRRAVNDVTEAEAAGRRQVKKARKKKAKGTDPAPQTGLRPWQHLAVLVARRPLITAFPEYRLALEMAVMEELERRELSRYARSLGEAWGDEEEIASIADDLLTPVELRERLAQLRSAIRAGRDG